MSKLTSDGGVPNRRYPLIDFFELITKALLNGRSLASLRRQLERLTGIKISFSSTAKKKKQVSCTVQAQYGRCHQRGGHKENGGGREGGGRVIPVKDDYIGRDICI